MRLGSIWVFHRFLLVLIVFTIFSSVCINRQIGLFFPCHGKINYSLLNTDPLKE